MSDSIPLIARMMNINQRIRRLWRGESRSAFSKFVGGIIALVSLIGAFASIAGYWEIKKSDPELDVGQILFIPIEYLLIFGLACSVFLLFFVALMFFRRDKALKRAASDLPFLGTSINAAISNVFVTSDPADDRHPSPSELHSFLAILEEVFRELTGTQCGVAIKLFETIKEDLVGVKLFNYMRDPTSKSKRSDIDNDEKQNPFFASANSAFDELIDLARTGDNSAPQGCSYYIENDLMPAHRKKRYKTNNREFWKHYTATLVVPISRDLNPRLGAPWYGFLCIDNKKGNFDEEICLPIACAAAQLLYNYFYLHESFAFAVADLPHGESRDVRTSV